jgi:hypothetical protein
VDKSSIEAKDAFVTREKGEPGVTQLAALTGKKAGGRLMGRGRRSPERSAHEVQREVSIRTGAGKALSVRREDVLLVEGKDEKVTWTTVRGAFTQAGEHYAGKALREIGWEDSFIGAGAGLYINPCRLRSILWIRKEKSFRILLDSGEGRAPLEVRVHPEKRKTMAKALGLAHLYNVEPLPDEHRVLWEEGLRDYSTELFYMTEDELRGFFSREDGSIDVRRLIANIIWQQFRWKRLGRTLSSDTATERGFWYRPVKTVLMRLGLLKHTAHSALLNLSDGGVFPEDLSDLLLFGLDWRSPRSEGDLDALMLKILVDMVGDYRLFTYRDLGFMDPEKDRCIGTTRPETVLVVEKKNLFSVASKAHERWGVSAVCLGGNPTWLPTEYFCFELQKALPPGKSVRLLTIVDYDPFGWILAEIFRNQLDRYGVDVSSMRHLVTPHRFTEEEIRSLSYVVESDSPAIRGKIEKWVQDGGGIDGEARAIQADHIWPRERYDAVLEEEISRPEPRRKARRVKKAKKPTSFSSSYFACPCEECAGSLILQGPREMGLAFVPPEEIALIREEYNGRLEAVSTRGEVYHLSKSIDKLWEEISAEQASLKRGESGEIVGVEEEKLRKMKRNRFLL